MPQRLYARLANEAVRFYKNCEAKRYSPTLYESIKKKDLFPDEFRAEVIRDIAEGPYMRGEVTVVPMKRDIMKIPTLESRPKVTWTEENTTKFLNGYKLCAMLVEKTVNCWDTLKRAISSEAYAVMRLNVQRLATEPVWAVM